MLSHLIGVGFLPNQAVLWVVLQKFSIREGKPRGLSNHYSRTLEWIESVERYS